MTHSPNTPGPRAALDGEDLRGMFSAATRLFERNVTIINALNVFPVPDGDTGTNMFHTLREALCQTDGMDSSSAGDVAAAMAHRALMAGSGNSGVILSQFYKGIAIGLDGKASFGSTELAAAFEHAREQAYKAVGDPVEGTMLTVIRRVAECARERADGGSTPPELLNAVCSVATDTVALTPTLLPVLREAGVVDAGAQGIAVILEGARRYLWSEDVAPEEISPPAAIGVPATQSTVSRGFLETTEEELYGYCTQFIIEGRDIDPEAVRVRMLDMAQSTVVVGDESVVRVHLHTQDPGPVISYAVTMGTLGQVKIENMDEQHVEYSAARRRESGPDSTASASVPMAVVAVAQGRGIEELFADLGAAKVIEAGDTMNPSVQQIMDAVAAAPSNNIVLLPNNRNIILAARQAAEMSDKNVSVVPSATIPQGVAAMLEFNLEKDLDGTLADMDRKLSSVRSGEICRAVRPVNLNGVSVEEGQTIALLERQLVAAGDEPTEVLVSLLKEAKVSESDLVTLYWGDQLAPEEAEAARLEIEASFPGTDVEVLPGGQPHYHYIVSIE